MTFGCCACCKARLAHLPGHPFPCPTHQSWKGDKDRVVAE